MASLPSWPQHDDVVADPRARTAQTRPVHGPTRPIRWRLTPRISFSVDFRDAFHGIVGGGDLAVPDAFLDNVARTSDGGQTWQLASHPTFTGAFYGLTCVRGREWTVVATGPAGVAWSPDEGDTWQSVADQQRRR